MSTKIELTPEDVRGRFSLPSRQAAVDLIRTHQKAMKAYKLGRLWRVSEDDLESWITSLKAPAPANGVEPKLSTAEMRIRGKAY